MASCLFLVALIVWGIPRDCTGQRYVILAPRTVRPYTSYELIVSNIGVDTENFLCQIVSTNETVVKSISVEVKPNELQKVTVPLTSLTDRDYKLQVWDHNKQALLNTTELETVDRSYLVLFQTDKPAYKPGDKVQFRVVFLFQNSKPVRNDVLPTIFITDPDRVRMKQWSSVSLSSGVFEGSFQLAEYTSLGTWTITASVHGQKYKDTFSVEEYTLPLFRVQMRSIPDPYFLCEKPHLALKLMATYVLGGPVRGNATVVVRAKYNNHPSQTKEVARKELFINGTATVNFPTNLVADNCDVEHNVWFDVTVTESSTGASYNATNSYTIHNAGGVTMEVVNGADAFYPGAPLQIIVKLATIDEKPIVNTTFNLRYKVLTDDQNDMNDAIYTLEKINTNGNGIAKHIIKTELRTMEINVEGVYKNRTFPLVDAFPMYEDKSLEYLSISATQVYYIATKNVTVNAYSNVKFAKIYYVAYCQGKVCVCGVQKSSNPVHNHKIEFASTLEMVPKIKFVSFAVKEDGKILSSALMIRFHVSRKGMLDIRPAPVNGSNSYMFNILAEKDAFVGLLGIDSRIGHRTTANNDITMQKWEQMLQSQDDSSILWSPYDSFRSVDVALLTDGYLPDVGFIPHSFGEMERSSTNTMEDTSVREHFPETWLWESVKEHSGNTSLERTLPDSITTWMVSGFSVGPVNGLQILKQPISIKSKNKIYVQFHMPPSIKRFENVKVNCLVHNYGIARKVSLEVRFKDICYEAKISIAQGATEHVPVEISSNEVGVLTVEAFLRTEKGNVLDSVRHSLPVLPEGLIQTVDDSCLLNNQKAEQKHFSLTLPVNQINGDVVHSEVTLSVVGTFLNLNMIDLEHMVQSSHGDGEESLLFLQTTMAVYDYLKGASLLSLETKNKLHSYMRVGYQQVNRYRLDDGSFSMFGSLHECGGVWFTASVVQALQKLYKYEALPVENSIINDGLQWLTRQSKADGSFNESCPIAHPHIQRTGGKELSLASSVLFSFVSFGGMDKYAGYVNKTLSLLQNSTSDDVYLLAKKTYLFTLIGHEDRFTMLSKLNAMSIAEGNNRYWKVTERNVTSLAKKRDQEATAYALLANLKGNEMQPVQMIQIAQWLQKHTFACDRCDASLERVVALEALAALADRNPSHEPNMSIQAAGYTLLVNATNRELLQTVTLPSNTTSVNVATFGKGLVLIKLSYRYSLSSIIAPRFGSSNTPAPKPQVSVNVTNNASLPKTTLKQLNICYFEPHNFWWYSNYKIVKLALPTGYRLAHNTRHLKCSMSTIELELESVLRMIIYVPWGTEVCCTVPVRKIGLWNGIPYFGSVFVSSFDTKDYEAGLRYYL